MAEKPFTALRSEVVVPVVKLQDVATTLRMLELIVEVAVVTLINVDFTTTLVTLIVEDNAAPLTSVETEIPLKASISTAVVMAPNAADRDLLIWEEAGLTSQVLLIATLNAFVILISILLVVLALVIVVDTRFLESRVGVLTWVELFIVALKGRTILASTVLEVCEVALTVVVTFLLILASVVLEVAVLLVTVVDTLKMMLGTSNSHQETYT